MLKEFIYLSDRMPVNAGIPASKGFQDLFTVVEKKYKIKKIP